MLLQGIALARLAFCLRRYDSDVASPFDVAISLTDKLVPERYVIMQTESANDGVPQVHISQKKFDLTYKTSDTAFQREMFNLADKLKSVFEQLDGSKRCQLLSIKNDALGITPFYLSGAWNKKTTSSTVDSISEGEDSTEPWCEEDLGFFGSDDARALLHQMDYEAAYVVFGVCPLIIAY